MMMLFPLAGLLQDFDPMARHGISEMSIYLIGHVFLITTDFLALLIDIILLIRASSKFQYIQASGVLLFG